MRLKSPVCNTAPTERFFDFSGSSACAPSATAIGSDTGKVEISNGTPLMKFVDVVAKYCCCSDGARKPVDAELRNANCLVKS